MFSKIFSPVKTALLSRRLCKTLVNLNRRTTNITTLKTGASLSTSTSSNQTSNSERPVRLNPGVVRLGVFPEEWFQFFNNKTGVTGPYVFAIGLGSYLVSKEIYVMEHDYYVGLSMLLLCYVAVKNVGPMLARKLDKSVNEYESGLRRGRDDNTLLLMDNIKIEERGQFSMAGQLILIAAKRENVALQLEANYRQRLRIVYVEVKKRLDYHSKIGFVRGQIEHKHIVQWIVAEVMKALTPEFLGKYLDQCMVELGTMAK